MLFRIIYKVRIFNNNLVKIQWLKSVNANLENIIAHCSQVRLYVYTHICAKHITYKVTYGAVREPFFLTWACQIALYLISHYRGYYLQYGNTGCEIFK